MQFFVLKQEPTAKPGHQSASMDVLSAEGTTTGDAPRCEACGDYVGSCAWLPPYRIELETWGNEFGDIAILAGTDLLVSTHFKEAWRRTDLKGLSGFEEVEIVKVIRRRTLIGNPPRYFRAVVSLSRTAIDLAASEFEWDSPPTCTKCLLANLVKRWKRIVIDRRTWTGEDIFIARGLSGTIIVSERFKEFCKVHNVKNACFLPAESFAYDFYPWERGASPS